MTTFLWIMLGGIVLGLIGTIVSSIMKKRKPVCLLLSIALAVMCIVGFSVDISINPIKNSDLASQSAEQLDFEEMVSEYRTNEIQAKNTYFDNRYKISAEVVNVEKAGVREGYSGYNVNMVIAIDGNDFNLCGNFQSDFKDEIMKLNVGDKLTFTGKCVAPELWYNCTIVEVN